jgi:hypothetical protein
MADSQTLQTTLNLTIPKLITASLTLYALYYIVKCPCDKLVACHFWETTTALTGALSVILLVNYKKLMLNL